MRLIRPHGLSRFRTIQISPKDPSFAPQHSPVMDKWPRSYSRLCGEQVGVTVALTSADAARHRNGMIE